MLFVSCVLRLRRCLLMGTLAAFGLPVVAQVQMSQDEFAVYNKANSDTALADKARDFEGYLTRYPNSAVKLDVLQQLLYVYSQMGDNAHALDAASRTLAIDPGNLRAITVMVVLLRQQADASGDPILKQETYGKIEKLASTALAAPRPAAGSDADYNALRATVVPVMYSAVGNAALNRKDSVTAIDAFRRELNAVPEADTRTPGNALQDTFNLAQAYYTLPTPDYLHCAYFAARAVAFAPEPFKSQMQPVANYCYAKYHGSKDGYDRLVAESRTSLFPPPTLNISKAPTPQDIVAEVIRTTPDLSALALSDREFILQYGTQHDADAAWNAVAGKSVQITDAIVIEANSRILKLAVTDDAKAAHSADFLLLSDGPMQTAYRPPGSRAAANNSLPAVGATVTVEGVYRSYTNEPTITLASGIIRRASAFTQAAAPAPVSVAAESGYTPPTRPANPVRTTDPEPAPARPAAPARGMQPVDTDGKTVPSSSIPHNYALVFATNRYSHWPELENPIPDADALTGTLKSLFGFQIEEVRNPTGEQILEKLTEYLHKDFQPQDQLLIFFSGHGYFDSALGQGYLIPADALKPQDDFGHMHMISHDVILHYVNRIPAKHVVLMLDACFSGTLDRKIADSGMRGDSVDFYGHISLPELIERKQDKRTRRYFTSGGADFVPDGEPGHHSPFVSALLVALNNNADRKGYVTLNDLQEGLETVKPEPRWGDIQNDNDPGSDFILITTSAARLLAGSQ